MGRNPRAARVRGDCWEAVRRERTVRRACTELTAVSRSRARLLRHMGCFQRTSVERLPLKH